MCSTFSNGPGTSDATTAQKGAWGCDMFHSSGLHLPSYSLLIFFYGASAMAFWRAKCDSLSYNRTVYKEGYWCSILSFAPCYDVLVQSLGAAASALSASYDAVRVELQAGSLPLKVSKGPCSGIRVTSLLRPSVWKMDSDFAFDFDFDFDFQGGAVEVSPCQQSMPIAGMFGVVLFLSIPFQRPACHLHASHAADTVRCMFNM